MFLFQGTVPLDTEQPDKGSQAQSLADQREQDNGEGEEDWFFRRPDDVSGDEAAPQRTPCGPVSLRDFSNKNQGLTSL
jgi:hypothetical protein